MELSASDILSSVSQTYSAQAMALVPVDTVERLLADPSLPLSLLQGDPSLLVPVLLADSARHALQARTLRAALSQEHQARVRAEEDAAGLGAAVEEAERRERALRRAIEECRAELAQAVPAPRAGLERVWGEVREMQGEAVGLRAAVQGLQDGLGADLESLSTAFAGLMGALSAQMDEAHAHVSRLSEQMSASLALSRSLHSHVSARSHALAAALPRLRAGLAPLRAAVASWPAQAAALAAEAVHAVAQTSLGLAVAASALARDKAELTEQVQDGAIREAALHGRIGELEREGRRLQRELRSAEKERAAALRGKRTLERLLDESQGLIARQRAMLAAVEGISPLFPASPSA